jgi:mono/diheme cytochrome c family protein
MFSRYNHQNIQGFVMTFSLPASLTISGLVLILTACNPDQHDHPKLTTGKQLFEYHCASCHGDAGQGLILKGVPGNKDTELSTGQIVHKIQHKKEGSMPEFTDMPRAEAIKIATYLKHINQ